MRKITKLVYPIIGLALCLSVEMDSQTTATFNFTGSVQTFVVPPCVTSVTIDAYGAQGANSQDRLTTNATGGLGGRAQGVLAVTPGTTLYIYVGGAGNTNGSGGYNGGGSGGFSSAGSSCFGGPAAGGGGASDVRVGATALSNRVIVAGGGGGSGRDYCNGWCQPCGCGGSGGAGGGSVGSLGAAAYSCSFGYPGSGINGGQGGSQFSGGNGGTGDGGGPSGSAGGLGNGGNGAGGTYDVAGGGGGGGYYGGGGGGGASSGSGVGGGGGGGGSSFIGSMSSAFTSANVRSGNGLVTITYSSSAGAPAQPASISGLSAVCAGATTTYSIAPVVGATTYTWTVPAGTVINSGQGTTSISVTAGSISGNVTVTASNSCGTSSPTTFLLTINPSPTVTASSANSAICVGGSTSLNASGASTYVWNPGNLSGSSVTVSPTTSATYTVTGTNANGCVNTATVGVTVNPLPTVTASSTNSAICVGGSTSLSASGASTYVWNPGNLSGSSVTVSPTTTTTYTVTGTNANGCVNTATVTLAVNPLPTVSSTASLSTICSGGTTTLTSSGASTYVWNPGNLSGSSVTVSPITTTTYTVTGTDASGCVNTSTVTITVNPSPTVTASSTNSAICVGGSTSLSASGASTYVWNPGNLSGSSVTVSPTTSTTYTVTGTNANGCVNTATVGVTVNPLPTVTASSANSAICVGGSTSLSASGASTYVWNPGNLSGSSVTVSPTTTTTYTVTGTNANGCVNTATVTLAVNPLPTVSSTASLSTICSGGTTTLTSSGASTYVWNPGNLSGSSVTVSPIITTTYTVTGTDASGCVNTSTVTVNVNASPVVTATTANASICVGDTSTLTAGGATSYVWSSGGTSATEQVSPSTTTTYTVTGTAANSCTNTATVTVNVNTLPTVTATTANASICVGGSATLTAGGATSYVWSSGGTSPTEQVSPATATTYTVTGTDANGCVNTATVIVNVNALPTVNLGADVTQCGGTLTLDAQNQGSTYLWSDNSMMQTLVVSTTGNYSVAVTDINGCVNTDSIVVTIDSVVIVNLGSDTTRCGGWVSLNAGNPGSTYLWSNSATGQASIVTSSGTYYVDVTTPSGCTGSDTIVVTINNQPIANLGPDTATCQGNITLDAGNPGSTYVWSNSASTQTITVGAGTYFVTVTDPSGCSDRDTISIQVNTPPTITVSSDTAICVGGQATLTASGGTGYLWSNGAPTQSITVSPTTSTAYYVTVTDSNICTASDFVIVNVLPGSTSQFTHTVSGSTAVFTNQSSNANTYNWNFGDNTTSNAVNPSHTYTQNGTFTVTLTVTGPCGSATFTQVVTITQVGLVEQGSLSDGINVYPNPNNGVFTLAINANLGDVVIEVVDMQGRVVYASNENNVQTGFTKQIGMETASSGMYMLRMTSANQVHVVKMNVQR